MHNLQISERRAGEVTILDLNGDVTIGENSQRFRAKLRQLLGNGKKEILLNAAHLKFVDSSGLGEIVSGYTAVERMGGKLKMENLTERFRDLMAMTKLLTVFDCFDNETEAVRSFQ